MAYEAGEDGDVGAVEADPGGDVAGDDLPGDGVIAGPALADVVQQGGDEQQVGPSDAAGEVGGADGGLDEVPVDGPGVHGVALGAAPDPLPVGQQPGDQALGLQGLPDLDGRPPGAEQRHQLLAGLGGPRGRQRLGGGRDPAHGVQGQGQPRLRGGRGGPQRKDGVPLGPGGAREHDLAVVLHDALGQRRPLGDGRLLAAEQPAQPWPGLPGPQHAADLAPGHVAGVGDGARGLVHLPQQGVGVEQAEFGGDLVLFLEGEAVGGAPGRQVQGVAYVEEGAAGLGEALAGRVGEPGGGDGPQRGGVAESAAGLLQVGFEEVAEFAVARGAFLAQLAQLGQSFGRLVAPVGEDGAARAGGEPQVTGDVAGVEQAEVDLQVVGGGLAGLGRGAHGVVEGEAEVPDGVPDAVGEGGDGARVGAAVVEEQQVEVAAGRQFAAAVAADGDQGDAPCRAGSGVGGARGEEAVQPAVRQLGERGTARRPGPRLLLEEAQPGRRVAAGSGVLRVC